MHHTDNVRKSSSARPSSSSEQSRRISRNASNVTSRPLSPSSASKPPSSEVTAKLTDNSLAGAAGPSGNARAQSHAVASSSAQMLHQPSSSPSKGSFSPFSRTTRSSSPSYTMGQVQSDARGPSPSLPSAPADIQPPTTMGQKLKLSWPVRRKKTLEAATAVLQQSLSPLSASSPTTSSLSCSPVSSAHSHDDHSSTPGRSKGKNSAKQMASQFASNALMAMKGKFNASSTSVSSPVTPPSELQTPPPLPPKSLAAMPSSSSGRSTSDLQPDDSQGDLTFGSSTVLEKEKASCAEDDDEHARKEDNSSNASSVSSGTDGQLPIADSPNANDASVNDVSKVQNPRRRERKGDEQAKDSVDDWRKSDSTLRTVRLVGPGGVPVGNRTPRPLSLAESTNSGNTVQAGNIPGVNAGKRLSALIMDADFGMPEVDSEDDEEEVPHLGLHNDRCGYRHEGDSQSGVVLSSQTTPTSAPIPTRHDRRQSSSPSPQSSPASGKISKLVKAARRGSNNISGRFSPSPKRSDKSKDEHYPDSDHDATVSGSDSEVCSSASIDGVPSASSSTTSVTSSPSRSSKDTGSLASSTYDYSYSSTGPSVEIASESSPGLHPWVSTDHKGSESSISLSASTTSSHSHSNAEGQTQSKETPGNAATAPVANLAAQRPDAPRSRLPSMQPRGLRQTAVSLTSASAGFAKGFGRKAVDKLGKALSGSSTTLSSSGSGTESSGPSAFQFHTNRSGHVTGRSASAQHTKSTYGSSGSDSQQASPRQKKKHGLKKGRTPNAPSGTWSVASSDSEVASNAPTINLGYLVRPPVKPGQGGLVFGRVLADCVRDTAVKPGTIGIVSISKGQKRARRASVGEAVAARNRVFEERQIPALVARCAQHLEKWGVQEEGLFRVNGRASHISKLRAEFDSGADYDMTESGPSELDPHAVASALKAFLRELPEPVLTRQLTPYFEEALHQENTMVEAKESAEDQARAQGSKGSLPKIRKPPSLSTFAVPTFMPRAPSQSLINAFASLISRLPQENRDLIMTVTELIRATAKRSKETKMPLSNLLLVFCPSLAMSPPLLRLLCEGEGIWDGTPEEQESSDDEEYYEEGDDDEVGDEEDIEDEVEESTPLPTSDNAVANVTSDRDTGKAVPRPRPAGPRGRVATIYLPASPRGTSNTTANVLSPSRDDDSDDRHSTQKLTTPADGRSPIDPSQLHGTSSYTPYSPPPLTASSESSLAPSSNAEGSSVPNHEIIGGTSSTAPMLTPKVQSDLPSPRKIRKSSIGNPIAFPAVSGSAPVTPVEFLPALRLSTYSSSSPELSPEDRSRRKSKISLQDLLPKRSLSSLLGRSPATPDSTRSFSTPPAQTRINSTPPILDFTLNQSPIKLNLGLDFNDPGFSSESHFDGEFSTPISPTDDKPMSRLDVPSFDSSKSLGADRMNSAVSTGSNSSGVFYTPPTSYRKLTHAPSEASLNSTGSYSLLEFGFDKEKLADGIDDSDGWARSVLRAANDGKNDK